MTKHYPAIFYPPLILKFLAKNYVSHSQITYNHSSKLRNLSNNKSHFSDIWLAKLSYIIIFYVFAIAIILSILMPSYVWLIAITLISIILGVLCFISSDSNQQTTKDDFRFIQIIPKVSSTNGMQERTFQVLVMATVNRLEFLPPELVRRFDEIIFVDLPHAGGRYEIFKLHLAKYFPGLDFCEKDWLRLLRETKLLTPAEIAMVVRKTAENAFYRNAQEFSGTELGEKPLTVTVKDFLEVLTQFTPSMIREEDKIVEIRNKAIYARPAASPDTSRWAKEPEVLFGN